MSKKPKAVHEPIKPLLELDEETDAKVCEVIAGYQGQATTLESAIGALVLGRHFGYRTLRMMHSPATYRKYEAILGVSFEEVCPERTHLAQKLFGIKMADKLGKFWDIVMGREKVEGKGTME